MEKLPYIARGVHDIPTASSVLVSSSRYLNNAQVRDWLATHFLRRNGPDRPVPADNIGLFAALDQVMDTDRIEQLFERERRINPALDRWLTERHLTYYKVDDFKHCQNGTVGGIFYRFLIDRNAEIEFIPSRPPKTDFEYFKLRHLQTHDFEHIITGAQFNSLGEIVPYLVNMTNMFKYLSAELAGELCVKFIFSCLRYFMRTMLHYPETWPTTVECIKQAIAVGQASEPIFMFSYDDVFHLTPVEARLKLGVREVSEVDTRTASAIWEGTMTLAMAMASGAPEMPGLTPQSLGADRSETAAKAAHRA